jgi:hypothetical protein
MSSLIRRLSQKIGIWLILFCSVSVPPGNLGAQTASDAIGTGTTWLLTVRYGMGVWALDAAPDLLDGEFTEDDYRKTYVRDTFEAAKTLQVLSIPVSEYQLTLDWLDFTRFNSAWQIAQKLQILSKAGSDITQVIATLLESRNPDSGFGGAKGYPVSNNLDTALALQAFKAANYSDTTLLGQSLNYLISNQNTDGGWGFTSGDVSNTYVTSIALRALSAYNSVFINQNSINQASAFLLAHQNTDGGFGDSPSTVYSTALSLMSMIESGQGSTQTILSGISYLTSSQLADGSWNDDPYSTALALQALAEARPNLSISSTGITFSNSMPQSGAATTISAVIRNTGYDNASNVIVRFYLGEPAAGGTRIGTDQIIPFIALGSSAQASITASFTGTGGKTIFVVVDPDNLISETSKADNKASARVWVATGPDLAVYSEDLKPSTSVPAPGIAFTLSYTVRNLGESPVNAFVVSLYDGDPTQGGTLLQTANISGINANDIRTERGGLRGRSV